MEPHDHTYIRLLFYLVVVFSTSASVIEKSSEEEDYTSGRIRVKRQGGYVYERPRVSFDLPTRSSVSTQIPIVSTQAHTVDRTQAQQMYYAYPAPGGGDTVNIGFQAGSTTTTAAGTGGGYNYGAGGVGGSGGGTQGTSESGGTGIGYNYGTPSIAAGTPNSILGTTAAGYGSTTGSQTQTGYTSGTTGVTGYNYGTPSTTSQPSASARTTTTTGTTGVSTNAPKYLPPLNGGGGLGSGDIGGNVGGTVNIGSTTSRPLPPATSPSEAYLPPLSVPSQPGSSSGVAPPSMPNYLPPNSSPSPSPSPSLNQGSPSSTLIPNTLTSGYLPPGAGSTAGTPSPVPPPAATYLPPVF